MKKILYVFLFLLPVLLVGQNASDLFISEYCEGSGDNKYIEIFNGTGSAVVLDGNYKIWKIANGGDWFEYELTAFNAPIPNNEVFVISYNSNDIDQDISSVSDLTWSQANFNGDDALALVKIIDGTDTIIDVIGTNGADPGSGWEVAGTANATKEHTLVRKENVFSPNANWASSAGTNTEDSEWIVYDQNTFDYIGSHTMAGTAEPSVSLLSLNNNEKVFLGSTVNVVWSSAFIDQSAMGTITLRYNYVNETYDEIVLATNVPNSGTFAWNIDETFPKTEDAKIHISINGYTDTSALSFAIYGVGNNAIIINEIMYKPAYSQLNSNYVEFHNPFDMEADLTGYKLLGNSFSHTFTGDNLVTGAGHFVVASDSAAFASVYPDITPIDYFEGSILMPNDNIYLISPSLDLVDMVNFSTEEPFPQGSSGTGTSIELISFDLDNNDGANWQDSWVLYGTPGMENSTQPTNVENIVINEIMYNPATALGSDQDYEYLELYNNSDAAIDLANFKFAVGTYYTFAENTVLEADSYIVIALNPEAITSHYGISNVVGPLGNNLANTSELIRLYNADNILIDEVKYSDSTPWPVEADSDGPSLELISADLDNSLPESWVATTVNGTPGTENGLTPVEENNVNFVNSKITLNVAPNPFNPATVVSFDLSKNTVAELDMFNIKGQKVKSFAKQQYNKGTNQIYLKADNLPTGIYFLKLKTEKQVVNKKVLLLK